MRKFKLKQNSYFKFNSTKQSSQLETTDYAFLPQGTIIETNGDIDRATHGHLKLNLTGFIYGDHIEEIELEVKTLVSHEQIKHIMGRSISDSQLKDLNECLTRFHINTIYRMRHFLSQCAHESGGMRWLKELASGEAYEGRRDLGNIYPGDGKKFKGAGVIQMTGRSNYTLLQNYTGDTDVTRLGCDYVASRYPFTSAGVWWANNKMNSLCDMNPSVKIVTKRVNGGTNGLADREKYYAKTSILQ